jgi:hypothetical protein
MAEAEWQARRAPFDPLAALANVASSIFSGH